MKTLFATAFLLSASSLVAAHAEWEIIDLPTTVTTHVASTTPATSIAPAQGQSVTK